MCSTPAVSMLSEAYARPVRTFASPQEAGAPVHRAGPRRCRGGSTDLPGQADLAVAVGGPGLDALRQGMELTFRAWRGPVGA